jgi:hypothetical protein
MLRLYQDGNAGMGFRQSATYSIFRWIGVFLLGMASIASAQDGPGDASGFDVAGMQAIRGTVARVEGSSLVVKLRGGVEYQVATSANTHFVKSGAMAPHDPAQVGDMVLAGGELDEKKHILGAIFVAVVDANELAQLDDRRAQWGKTWIAGTITAKDGTVLTVKRPDGVVERVSVDESTSFRKRHQSITYPDLVVGDGMTATGEQVPKHDFGAKVITVVDAAVIREWSRVKDQ